jgi:hypothetical protein
MEEKETKTNVQSEEKPEAAAEKKNDEKIGDTEAGKVNSEKKVVIVGTGSQIPPLERYFGSKIIMAAPMERQYFNGTVKGWPMDPLNTEEGYLVQYEDGYISWSPKETFEAAYHRIDYLNFGHALEAMKRGHKVARKGWNGKGIHIELQVPDENSKMTSPYIFIDTTGLATDNIFAPKSRVPWLASQTDMLAEDWIVIL